MTKWRTAAWVSVATLASIAWRGPTALAAAATRSELMPDGLNATPVQVPSAALFGVLGLLGTVAVVLLLRNRFVHEPLPSSPLSAGRVGPDKRFDDVTTELAEGK